MSALSLACANVVACSPPRSKQPSPGSVRFPQDKGRAVALRVTTGPAIPLRDAAASSRCEGVQMGQLPAPLIARRDTCFATRI